MYNALAIATEFKTDGIPQKSEPFGCGHINDTFLITTDTEHLYVLQRINTNVFKNPKLLMDNYASVTEYLKKYIANEGGNPERGTLNLIPTKAGENWLEKDGKCWRMTIYIDNTVTIQIVQNAQDFYWAGRAFGKFTCQLADYPSETLGETIPNFHNTPSRYRDFEKAVEDDVCGRAASVKAEIDFARTQKEYTSLFVDMLDKGELPLRVTHNDTKLNNVLLDEKTGEPVAVVDLDTVMPGLSLYDFGDSIRFGTNPAAEDEKDLSKVYCDLNYFESYAKGYLEECGKSLTENELRMLPHAGKMMTLECGLRFLTDYLNGDTYFKIHREEHNLDRCRTQFKLVEDMTGKIEDMRRIIDNIVSNL